SRARRPRGPRGAPWPRSLVPSPDHTRVVATARPRRIDAVLSGCRSPRPSRRPPLDRRAVRARLVHLRVTYAWTWIGLVLVPVAFGEASLESGNGRSGSVALRERVTRVPGSSAAGGDARDRERQVEL